MERRGRAPVAKLRPDALDKFDLLVDVLEGYIGRMTLEVPWHALGSQIVKIRIDDVFVLLGPTAAADAAATARRPGRA